MENPSLLLSAKQDTSLLKAGDNMVKKIDVLLCPDCGLPVSESDDVCPHCGFDFVNADK